MVCDVQQGSKVTCTFLWGDLSPIACGLFYRDRECGRRRGVWCVMCSRVRRSLAHSCGATSLL